MFLLVAGLACVVFAVTASRIAQPQPLQLDPDGETAVPQTHFFQNGWVLYGSVDDPRRPPTPEDVGCEPQGTFTRPPQPTDMTVYGSRVIDGASIAAVELLSRSGPDASIVCIDASDYAPLWLAASSEAPAFTPTAIGIVGALLLVGAALVHPAVVDLSLRRRSGSSPKAPRKSKPTKGS